MLLIAGLCAVKNKTSTEKANHTGNCKKAQPNPAITVIKIFKVKLFSSFFPSLSLKKKATSNLMGLTILECF